MTALLADFEALRRLMDDTGSGGSGGVGGVPQALRVRFSREYKTELRDVRERAVRAGPDNNFYNDVAALHAIYRRRAHDAVARAEGAG